MLRSLEGARARRTTLLTLFTLLTFVAAFAQGGVGPGRSASVAAADTPPNSAEAHLLETGQAARLREAAAAAAGEFKVVSYNIRWRGGEDLQRLVELLRQDAEVGGAAVIGLQEVDRNKKRTRNVNTARLMADSLGMHYAWAAPPTPPDDDAEPEEEETGVALLSLYPLADVRRIVLPHEGPGKRRRVALGATVRVGGRDVRVYSVHGETRIKMEQRVEQLGAVLEDLRRLPPTVPSVVLGDFNTIRGRDVRACVKLFTESGFSTPIPHDRSTFKVLLLKLKLDWIWLRGFEAVGSGIDRDIGLSDHWPLWVRVRLADAEKPPTRTTTGTR
ncbi:MAG TPA: endonuclease/exonuclease/phosphatase family protein [Pyrinomonadaceae bacterium]|nr:endonuclease/exonuclease/phosphatase family protein [Pyrinomonadaceae bacterium]